jgi:autotransporter-associated beta strand protein
MEVRAMALFEMHRGLWRGLRPARERRPRGDLGRNRQLALEVLEIRVTMSASTWNGNMDGNWSTDLNWDVAPMSGSDLVFPSGALNQSNTNDILPPTVSYGNMFIAGSGYTIAGNQIALAKNLDSSQASGDNTLSLPIELDGGTVSVDESGASLLVPGAISGSNGLTKSGPGILDLLGPNTYTGTTTVNGGVLYVDTTQPGSPVTLNTGATLGGDGTVGAITANAGTVSPGTSTPGKLTVSGDLNLSAATTFSVALNGPNPGTDYSQLIVANSGSVSLGGATLSATAVPLSTVNNQFMIIDNTGTQPISGTFAGLPQGAQLMISNEPYRITYTGGDGNDVVLTSLVNSTTSVTPSSTSVIYGSPITLTATVASADSSFTQTPTGTVQFFDGGASLGPAVALVGGTATMNNAILPAGTHDNITALYNGDSSFASSTSPAASTVTVAQSSTSTALEVTPTSLVTGQSVALKATVSPGNPGGVSPTGTVQFFSGSPATGRLLGTVNLSGGVANLTVTSLTTADTSITASYNMGDTNYLPSVSAPTTVTVTQSSTTTALTVTPMTSGFGSPVTLAATVTATNSGSGTPTGSVQFMNGGTLLGTEPLVNGTATLMTSSLPLGANPITAIYGGDTNYSMSTSAQMTATVSNASMTTASASAGSIVFGQSETLSATVTPAVGTTPTPTGSVVFMNNGATLGTATLTNGTAQLVTTTLPVGTLSITAVYQGDSNYAGSTSPATTVTVAQASTTTALTVTPNPSGFGQTATLKATITPVSPGSGSPTGTVTFMNGGTSLGTGTISAGVASLMTTALPMGANSITAVYGGDTDFITSTSPAVTANVSEAANTTLSVSPNTAVTGQPVTLTATVVAASGMGTPTGTINFMENGSTSLGTATLSSGMATLTTMSLLVGTPSITAVYSGDSTFAQSTSPAMTVTVTKANTNSVVTIVPSPSFAGATVTLNAIVTAASPGTGTPTGTVQWFNGTTSLGTATLLSNGTASMTTSALTVGMSSITVNYQGDTNYNASTSPAVSQTVLPTTTTTVASSPSPSVVGQPVTLTAGVSSTAGVPDGMVQFFHGTTSLGTATLSGGVASITTSSLPFGFNSITANYMGSGSFSPSTSTAITQTVQQASTTMTLIGSPNPAALGSTVTFTATIHPAPPSTGGPTPTGSITFMNGTTFLGTATLTNGVATFTTSSLTVGPHSITGVYVNDGNYSSSTSPAFIQNISAAVPTVTLTIATSNPVSNQALLLTAKVAAVAPATATPTGTVNFFSNGTLIGSGTITNGQATFTASSLVLGNQVLTAVYQGDTNFAGGTSAAPAAIKVGDGNQLYVNELYLQMFGQIADPSGLANYTTLLANGFSRRYVVHDIARLSGLLRDARLERAVLGNFAASRSPAARVAALYEAILGRQPSARELRKGVAQLHGRGGSTTLITNLLASNENFQAAFIKGSPGGIANVASGGIGSLA